MIPKIGKTTKFIHMMIQGHFTIRDISLTREQFIVLLCLEDEMKPQSFLTVLTERDKGSLTRLVQSLEKKKYIKREVSQEDSRVNEVEITEEGKRVLNQTKPLMSELLQRLEIGIDEQEKQVALKVIQQIQDNAMLELEKLEHTKKS